MKKKTDPYVAQAKNHKDSRSVEYAVAMKQVSDDIKRGYMPRAMHVA